MVFRSVAFYFVEIVDGFGSFAPQKLMVNNFCISDAAAFDTFFNFRYFKYF